MLHRQVSTGTLPHSINSEERQALEVFDQIYEEHISDEETLGHQRASVRKSSNAHVPRHTSLGKHRRHDFENTMYSVLGPGFQEGTTSFAQSDSGEQSDVQSIAGPFKETDGNFYFMGVRQSVKESTSSAKRNDHGSIQDKDKNENGATNTHKSRLGSTGSGGNSLPQPDVSDDLGAMRTDVDAIENENQCDNHVTTITEQNDNGSVTSYTIRSNITTDNQLYHSTVVISQNSEILPPLPPFSSHPSYNTFSSKASSTMRRASDNDTEQWNTLYSNNTTSHRSHVSNIDDYLDDSDSSVEQEEVLTNQNQSSVPEYAHVQKVDMKIHRIQNDDGNKTPSWLHKEFVNTAYVSD